MNRRDVFPIIILLAAFAVFLSPVLFTHQVYFLQDITKFNHPWRVLTSEQLQRGQVPLWNPYALLGLPLLGNFQMGLFFPLSLFFLFFPFSQALGFYLMAACGAAAAGAYLWLRSLRLPPWACFGGAAAFAASGYCVSHMEFPNLLGAFIWMPSFFLFSESFFLFAIVSSFSFLSGYPLIWGGLTFCLFVLRWLWPRRKPLPALYVSMAAATFVALMISAAVLFPGFELSRQSARGTGLSLEESTNHALEPYELTSLIRPEITRRWAFSRQEPHEGVQRVVWEHEGTISTFTFHTRFIDPLEDAAGGKFTSWKSGYVGLAVTFLSMMGMAVIALRSPWRAVAFAGYAVLCVLLMLGRNFPISVWIWMHVVPLSYFRGPARLSYLMLALTVPLTAISIAAIGRMAGRRKAGAGALTMMAVAFAILAELMALGWRFSPTMPNDYYAEKGDMVDFLNRNLGADRYYQTTTQEAWPYLNRDDQSADFKKYREAIYRTNKRKLFGIGNVPFHLAAATGEYEALMPAASQRVLQEFKKEDKTKVVDQMRWADIRYLMDRRPILGTPLKDRGVHLWHIAQLAGPLSRSYWLPDSAHQALLGRFSDVPKDLPAIPWKYERAREDRFQASGIAGERGGADPSGGWLYVAEPYYPGWEAFVNGHLARTEPALDAFTMAQVPAGPVRVDFIYRPQSWRVGRWITVLTLCAIALVGFRKIEAL